MACASPEDFAPIAASTRVGHVALVVADIERSIDYYTQAIGLRLHRRAGAVAALGAGEEDVVIVHEQPGARPAHGHTGLFHFALLLPDRPALARWLARALDVRLPLTGASDHLVSEAIYLQDPDGHGIEIYRDRPRAQWRWHEGAPAMDTLPLDLHGLLADAGPDGGREAEPALLPPGTRMGHVHLRVAEIPATEAFYRDVLGFSLTVRYGSQATFLAAGGYHHHIGANTWQSAGASPPPPGAAALTYATIVLPDAAERARVLARLATAGRQPVGAEGLPPTVVDADGVLIVDPSGNRLLLATG